MFEVDQFVSDCRAAFKQDPTHRAVREVLARAVSEPVDILRCLGEPKKAEIGTLFHSDKLTILNVVWAPLMTVMPHNHRMWAVIGIYSGREDNIFWHRVLGSPGKIKAVAAKALCECDAEPLGTDTIHSVLNPIGKLTGAIHIYGGDFFATERSEWDRKLSWSIAPTVKKLDARSKKRTPVSKPVSGFEEVSRRSSPLGP